VTPGQVGDDPGELVAERIHIRTLLAQLRERDQEVLRLSAWEQLTASEAATVMGCSVATYKVRLHRARRRFSALIAASASEDVELIDRIFTAERTTR
jgi:RNA polymerase sigma-70 factor (ECF subfamily)